MKAVLETNCPDLKLITRGKVRDLYDIDEESLLFVATDRISAFDVVMDSAIPGKGKILTQMTEFWFDLFSCENHLITADIKDMPEAVRKYADQLEGRSMLVKKLEIQQVEAIVRGYITGSGWKEYTKQGTVCDIKLPEGLEESEQLEKPLYTPSTKAEQGLHDENIHPDEAEKILGKKVADEVANLALELYTTARNYAKGKGIIIADTKFEFGLNKEGKLILADEVLTPDSSRFWPLSSFKIGGGQDSFDKQFVRDYLLSINFDKKTPVKLPEDVIAKTMEKYVEAFVMLTGKQPAL